MSRPYITILLAITVTLAGCKAIPSRDPTGGLSLTENYARQQENFSLREDIPARWWETYNDPELDNFIETALVGNTAIETARARLEQAAAVSRQSLADLMPSLDISAERESTRGDNRTPSSFSLRGAAGYELDVWNENKASYTSDKLSTQAALEDMRSTAITVTASIVENWIRLAALREEEALITEQVETNRMVLDLQHRRYAGGAAEVLDVLQQKEVLARAEALLPDIKAEQDIIQQQLAVLAGQTPSVAPSLSVSKIPDTLPVPETGLPVQLLQNRPDIVAAWLRVEASDWDTHAAWAQRLPSFNLSGTYSTSSAGFSPLIETWLLNLAASMAAPVFDGGARKAEEERRKALSDERLVTYKDTVLDAIAEVENALTRNHYQTMTMEAVNNQLEAARSSLEQAQISYAGGNTSYLSVLNGLLNVQSLERQMIQEKRDMALFRVALYRAIGLRKTADTIVTTDKEISKEQKRG